MLGLRDLRRLRWFSLARVTQTVTLAVSQEKNTVFVEEVSTNTGIRWEKDTRYRGWDRNCSSQRGALRLTTNGGERRVGSRAFD